MRPDTAGTRPAPPAVESVPHLPPWLEATLTPSAPPAPQPGASRELVARPEHGWSREERRRRRARLRLAKRVLAVGAVLSLVAAVFTGVQGGVGPAKRAAAPVTRSEAGRTLLWLQNDGTRLEWAILLVAAAGGGGEVLFLPAGLWAEVPGRGPATLADAPDAATAALVVGNVVGVRVDTWLSADLAGLEDLFGRLRTLAVDVPADIVAAQSGGEDRTVFEAGRQELDAKAVVTYLSARTDAGELGRLARQKVVWSAVFGRFRGDPEGAGNLVKADLRLAPAGNDPGPAAAVLDELAADTAGIRYGVLPVVAGGPGAGGRETFKLDVKSLPGLRERMPARVVLDPSRPRLELRAPPAMAGGAAARVAPQSFRLVLSTDETDLPDVTRIIYYRESERGAAVKARRRLGAGVLVRERTTQDVVDVTVVVGADLGQ